MNYSGSLNVELTIKAMQRQLLQIADRIPDDILLTLLKCFAQILTREPEPSTQVCGPFIRAFTKLRDDGVEKQFQAIIEEDEDQFKDDKNAQQNDGDQECTFNYKIGNVVTQEVIFSMGDANVNGDVEPDVEMKLEQEEESKISEENKINEEQIEEKFEEISKEAESSPAEIPVNPEEPKDSNEQEPTNDTTDDSEKPQIDEQPIEQEPEQQQEQPQVEEEQPQPEVKEERPVIPMEKVTLDDIQREIHEMQMFLFNKGIAPEIKNNMITRNGIVKKPKKPDDAYKVDVCINLNKNKSGEKKSKSKEILSNYLKDGKDAKAEKENQKARRHIFDPSVPNTPEDFMKEKSVTEKIKKQKQNIKHLDVSWQKLCDSQRKVYRHSNFKSPNADKENGQTIG
ncbi:probable E3 ubiquitin-protein ligase bre1 isoform X2 [Chironomus tepperi]|uniref:probable E3 ubiquitin-protein ligase bre1 isoform X2 n=1 Tax=Chironomus tepperi TaxID=113505 RepID=UPI00391EFCE7